MYIYIYIYFDEEFLTVAKNFVSEVYVFEVSRSWRWRRSRSSIFAAKIDRKKYNVPYRLLPACLTKNHNRVPQEEPSAGSKIMMRTMCRLPTIPFQRKASIGNLAALFLLSSPHLCAPIYRVYRVRRVRARVTSIGQFRVCVCVVRVWYICIFVSLFWKNLVLVYRIKQDSLFVQFQIFRVYVQVYVSRWKFVGEKRISVICYVFFLL